MTAPDPGLTDLIAAHTRLGAQQVGRYLCLCGWVGDYHDHPAHVALVVEQHTNGRITELYEQRDNAIEAGFRLFDRAEKAEATIARVEALADSSSGRIVGRDGATGVPLFSLRAALEGEQQ